MEKNTKDSKKKISNSFFTGVMALVFLTIGYQTALFIQKAAVAHIVSDRDCPDTVYVYVEAPVNGPASNHSGVSVPSVTGPTDPAPMTSKSKTRRVNSAHGTIAQTVHQKFSTRKYENFQFNPNTVSIEELQLLGFSLKQAQSIDNYRKKGGQFRRKSDFAKSYVVSDSIYRRLEPYIDIPRLDINQADSASFDKLPGIGGYFAAKMVAYRQKLHGYSTLSQLMEIPYFDEEKFKGLEDLVTLSDPAPYPLWNLPADSLYQHPYIRSAARSILLFRENNPKEKWTLENLFQATILTEESYQKLSRCHIAPPE